MTAAFPQRIQAILLDSSLNISPNKSVILGDILLVHYLKTQDKQLIYSHQINSLSWCVAVLTWFLSSHSL